LEARREKERKPLRAYVKEKRGKRRIIAIENHRYRGGGRCQAPQDKHAVAGAARLKGGGTKKVSEGVAIWEEKGGDIDRSTSGGRVTCIGSGERTL